MVVVGVILTAWGPEGDPASGRPGGPVFLAMAVGSAMLFGASLFAVGHASQSVPGALTVVAGRGSWAPVRGIAADPDGPIPDDTRGPAAGRRVRLDEVLGFLVITWGAKDSIAITAVLSSQFAVIVPLVSMVVFKERMLRHQLLGAALTGLGVAGVTLAQL